MKKWREKLKARSGETIVETLISVLIISLGVVMLAGSIITSARLNRKAGSENMLTFSDAAAAQALEGSYSVTLSGAVDAYDDTEQKSIEVTVYANSPDGDEVAQPRRLYYYD